MFLLGCLSVVQMALLPGLLLLAVTRFRATLIQLLAVSFALSFAANYAIVTLLVAAGSYTRPVVMTVIAAEAMALWFLRRRIEVERTEWPEHPSLAMIVALVLAAESVLWAGIIWLRSLGTVFTTWDAVVSWNRWALVFAGGSMPADIQYYPQLIPANWSLSYLLIESSIVQAFAKSVMALFFLLTLLVIADAGLRLRSAGLILGVPATALLERKCVGLFIADGYVDVPVAFFATVSAMLLVAPPRDTTARLRSLWLSCACAAAAALTKQAGVYLLLVWPLLAFALRDRDDRQRPARVIPVSWVVFAAPVFAFYVHRYDAIRRGLDFSNVRYVTHDIYQGASVLQRAMHALQSLGIYVLLLVVPFAAIWFLPRWCRWLVALIALPFSVIWACYFSYDTRNLVLALPFAGIAAGIATEQLMAYGARVAVRFPLRLIGAVAAFVLLAGAAAMFSRDRIEATQLRQQREILCAPLNQRLYDWFGSHSREGRIATNYAIDFLPDLKGQRYPVTFVDVAELAAAESRSDVAYVLVPAAVPGAVRHAIDERRQRGEYELLFEQSSECEYAFYRVIRDRR